MKNLKHILLLLPLLLMFSACEKEKLEDSERGKQLLGKWNYQYGGYYNSMLNFVNTSNSDVNYEIEFLEGAKISINDDGSILKYKVRSFSDLLNTGYGAWRSQLDYGKEKEELYLRVHYYSEDSIMIERLPSEPSSPSQYNGVNVFYRVE
jgi:hypothetical protein